ncbi:M28 family peptidase [Kribbella sp. NPDC051587]|uniref:M28 family peptidase n=1 Tax=Kribbella sp. NPDC051587 TaxID=3364119 RepID=UPI0037A4C1FD
MKIKQVARKRALKTTAVAALVAAMTATALTTGGWSGPSPAAAQPPTPAQLAANSADGLVSARLPELRVGKYDTFVRRGVVAGTNGSQYVPYDRLYQGLPVVGGDFVIVTDHAGHVLDTSVAQTKPLGTVATKPAVSQAGAESVARRRLAHVQRLEGSRLVVDAHLATPRLAWESTVSGQSRTGEASRLSVYVDAFTGKVLRTQEHVAHGSGTAAYNGPNPVQIATSNSGGQYSMRDPEITNLSCQDYSTNQVFTKSTDTWGNGQATNKETGCVDALFAAQTEKKMLSAWLGRNAMDGNGGAWPMKVGLSDVNAYYDGSAVTIGHNQANAWIPAMDVVAHEMGHGIDDHTPGGISQGGTQEFVADTFGAATEWYANESSQYDPPDYTVGEEINLTGSGPIRNMADPSKVNGDPNCYSSSVPGSEVHKAAGPGNHWFYLLAEGTNPTDGQPTSPTCNGSTVTGLGIQKAITIMYNAMLLKTSSSSYLKYRTWALQAAKNLYPGSCTEFNTVKAAWDAVSVPAQSGDPTCITSSNDYSLAVTPSSASVQPGQSTTATVATQVTQGSATTVNLSAAVTPSGPTVSVSPSSVTSGNSATLNIATTTGTPAGSYTVTVTGSGPASHSATFTLTVGGGNGGTTPDIDVAKIKADLSQLNTVATNNGGTRRAGTAGHTQSVAYIEDRLKAAGFTTVHQRCSSCSYPSDNLVADWPGGDSNQVIMLGSHLDSVSAGPGINDNGSGSATILQIALALAQQNPAMAKHVRFAWWTGEEQGEQGSQFYVNSLTSAQKSAIKTYYNFDMVASPNGGYFINHLASSASTELKAYWDSKNLQPEENTEGAGRSDDYQFEQAGIATSGYAAGASATKTSAQASKWGGSANRAYDSCYHQSCDTATNINDTILNNSADGTAYSLWKVAVGATQPSPVTVANPGAQTSTAGQAISPITLTASGGTAPYTWSATGLPAGLSISASGTISGTPSSPGSANVTVTARDNTGQTAGTSFTWTINPSGGGSSISNGDFEAGNLSGWTVGGTAKAATVVSTGAHAGSYAVRLGDTTATNGESTVSQTFTAPANATRAAFWYNAVCPDTVTYAWAKATLTDNTAGSTATPLAKTCTNNQGWKQVAAPVTAGHSYTLTLVNRDDNYPGDPAYTLFDDVTTDGTSTPPGNDFSISTSPASLTVQPGQSATATITTTASGTPQTVTLSAAGLPAGATASFNPASVTAGGSATLTIATQASTPAGTSQVTVTGTAGSLTHTAVISLAVGSTTPPPSGLTKISTDPYSNTDAQHATQLETVSYAAGNTVVTAWQNARYENGAGTGVGWGTSTDAGVTWQQGKVPGLTKTDGGTYDRVALPAVAYDAKHAKWLIASTGYSYDGSSVKGMAVAVNSSADGVSWGNPITAIAASGSQSLDKDWIACDNVAASPRYGTCYTVVDDFAAGNQLSVATSTDGGSTWTAAKSVSGATGALPTGIASQPNGNVVVLYDRVSGGNNQMVVQSTDGGGTWSQPINLSELRFHQPAGGVRGNPLPRIDVDAGGKYYAVWPDSAAHSGDTANDIVLSTSTDGKTWSAKTRIPIAAVDSGKDHYFANIAVDHSSQGSNAKLIVYYHEWANADCTAETCQLTLAYITSTDGGAHWSAPVTLAGPFGPQQLANTSSGRFLGNYIAGSVTAGKGVGAWSIAKAPTDGKAYDQSINAGTQVITGGSVVGSTLAPAKPAQASHQQRKEIR